MKKVAVQTLGCPKNSVDSERLAGYLKLAGFQVVEELVHADLVILNTCGFVEAAVKEGIDAILDLEELKETKQIEAFAVVGCLVNRYGDELKQEFPSVDYWAKSEEWTNLLLDLGTAVLGDGRQILTRTPWTRYLKISEGCNCACSYCAIPGIRGRLRSLPFEKIEEEARLLISEGAKEICLVGQELTEYGSDLYGQPSLLPLLDRLEPLMPDQSWLRLFYLHPSHVNQAMLKRVAQSDKIVPWLDIPIQHIDSEVLRRMARPPIEDQIWSLFRQGRQFHPDFAFRTTLMVGFPGETEAQFEKLLDFVEEIQFDRLGAFQYSPEPGTPAAQFDGQVPDEVKQERFDRLMTLQQQISAKQGRRFVGRTLKALVESVDEDGVRWGRTYRDAPEIDGLVGISGTEAACGQFVKVRIDDSDEYDLFGEAVS